MDLSTLSTARVRPLEDVINMNPLAGGDVNLERECTYVWNNYEMGEAYPNASYCNFHFQQSLLHVNLGNVLMKEILYMYVGTFL